MSSGERKKALMVSIITSSILALAVLGFVVINVSGKSLRQLVNTLVRPGEEQSKQRRRHPAFRSQRPREQMNVPGGMPPFRR